MVEIAISVAAKIAEYLVAPVARPFRYLWHYKTNLENLKNEVKKLEAKRDTVERLIKVGEEPLPDVKLWQENVKKIIDEASELINKDNPEQANTQCCKGFSSPNLLKHYQCSKKAAGKLKDVDGLQREGEGFREYSRPTITKQPWLQSSEDFDAFESRMSILKKIMDALHNPDVNKVGIYGMGGIGKTTLAKEVGREAERDKLFNNVVFVEVSESPDIKTIQGVIADNLKLKLAAESLSGRASELYEELKEKKKKEKILLILDNIWGTVDFKEVGIPLEEDRKELKLLLTTRSCDVLTNHTVESQHQFPINVLNGEDAWSLFKSKAGESIEKPYLESIATEVVEVCGGIPLAIVVIAEALKNKGREDWKNALRELKQPLSVSFDEDLESFEGDLAKVYKSIELSYKFLGKKELQQIFLLCSRMGRTHDASIQDLFRYGFGLGYFENINTMEEALCNVYALVNKLKATSLLLGAPNSQKFSVHDVVCHTARKMASREHVFTVIDDVIPRFLTNENTLSKCTSLTLHNYGELPKDLPFVCPNLKFLYMKAKKSFSRILDDFFAHMLNLQVLHLVEMYCRELPTSFSFLVNLQALCLDQCILGDTTVIGNLKKLEILSFRGSIIEKLHEEMHHLTRLRLLDLTDCFKLSVIPPDVMSNLTKLEALYMLNTSILWEVERPNIERCNASIDELKHLGNLTLLEIHILDANMSKGLLSPKLERYKIIIGDKWKAWGYHSQTCRTLKLSNDTTKDGIISQLKEIEELELGEVLGAKNVLDALDSSSFPTLKHLKVMSSSHCSCIVESFDALTSLQSLILEYLDNMEKICNSPLGANPFLQLRTIRVVNCPKLNNIFSFSTVTALLQLEEIKVFDCKNMEEIFAIGGQDDSNNTEVVNEIKFSQLRIMVLSDLPRLKSFCCKVNTASALQLTSDTQPREIIYRDGIDVPTSLFNDKVVFPNLQTLHITDIHVEKIWHNLPPKISSCVQNLTELSVSSCGNLKELFSSSTVVAEESREEEMRDTILFPKLNRLRLSRLEKLTKLWSGYHIEFPTLKEFSIKACPQLDVFIFDDKVAFANLQTLHISKIPVEKIWHLPPKISSCVQNLTELSISNCGNLKELFSSSTVVTEESREEEIRDTILFPKLNCLYLNGLEKLTTLWSGYYIEFPTLKEFGIQGCPQLDVFIFDDKVRVPSLEKMRISDMDNLKMIWHNQLDGDSFSKLKSLEVDKCRKLLKVFPSNICGGLLSLKSLKVSDCGSLEEIFDLQGIISEERNLKMIWHNQHDGDSFPKLKSLEVNRCQKLLTLFPLNIRGRFLSLESLDVWSCGSLEEIFDLRGIISEEGNSIATRELCFSNLQKLFVMDCQILKSLFAASNNVANDEYSPKFLFPKLTSLVLYDLPELRSFYQMQGPVLKTLELRDCFIHDTDEDQMQMQQPFFFVEQAFPCLEQLVLSQKNNMMMWQGQVPESLFVKLKILVVLNDDSTGLPLCIIQRFQNLEKLTIERSSYKEIFSNGEDQTQAPTPARIKTLHLYQLRNLKYMWKQNFKLDLILQNLEVLIICDCNSLINVMPPSASFQNLTVMQVDCCSRVINIGTSTAAKSLVQLTQMTIRWCENIIEVVGNHGDVTEDEIIFPKLKSLSLQNLPSLTSFCSWNVTLHFPSLEELTVLCCPKMKIFSRGVLTTQTLQRVKINFESIELRPDVDINKAIQQFHEKMNVSEDHDSEDYSNSSESLEMLQEDNELNKATQQLDEEANVQSSIKDCEGSSSHHLEIKHGS